MRSSMMISNINYILHGNQVLMVNMFSYWRIFEYYAKHLDIAIGNYCSNHKPPSSF